MPGQPGFRMPAFSRAMAATVSPRNAMWSSDTGVMMLAAVRATTLVASSRPPIPTSSTSASACTRENARKAAAPMISKKVIGSPALTVSTSSSNATRASSEMRSPASRMRSLKRTRCGDVKTWTRRPDASRIARR